MIHIIKYLLLAACLIWASFSVSAQVGLNLAESTRSLSLGGASVLFQNIDAAYSNQAGLAYIDDLQAIAFVERRFDIQELSTVSLAVAKKFGFGTTSFQISNFGIGDFNNQKIGLAYARRLFDNLSIGGQLDLFNTQIKGFGSTQYITFELGLYSILSDQVHLSAHVFSPGSVGITQTDQLSSQLSMGLKYIPSKKVNITIQFNKVIDSDDDIRIGIEYHLIDNLTIRLGTSVDPAKYSFGFMYRLLNGLSIEGGYSFHQVLGSTPGVSLKYQAR